MSVELIIPLITLIIGWGLSQLGVVFSNIREEKTRKLARTEKLEDQRVSFQRQTLLELQEALSLLARATGRIHHEDMITYRKTGLWQKHHITEEWNQKEYEANVRTNVLMVRVADEELRKRVEKMRMITGHITISKTPEEAEQSFVEAIQIWDEVNDHLGRVLRSTY